MTLVFVGLVATTFILEGESTFVTQSYPEKIENVSYRRPLLEIGIAGIPTILGVWGTYHVLTGERSPATWARLLNATVATDRLSIIIRNAFHKLKRHELVALIASSGAFMGGMICTTTNLAATLIYGIRAYRAQGVDREQWLHATRGAVTRCVGSLALSGLSVLCMLLLADYKQSGEGVISEDYTELWQFLL